MTEYHLPFDCSICHLSFSDFILTSNTNDSWEWVQKIGIRDIELVTPVYFQFERSDLLKKEISFLNIHFGSKAKNVVFFPLG